MRKLVAEGLGTFVLVLSVYGSAVLAAAFPQVGIGFTGVALASGLSVMVMIFAVGHISGGHFNPAVTIGLAFGGRFPPHKVTTYIIAQLSGAAAAGCIIYLIATGKPDFDPISSGFAANGYGEHSPGGYNLIAGIITEVVLTAIFLIVIMGATRKSAPQNCAPVAIGMALTLLHLISIPVTNTSLNPARSTVAAIFQGTWALEQLWMFWLMPIIGAIIGGLLYRLFLNSD